MVEAVIEQTTIELSHKMENVAISDTKHKGKQESKKAREEEDNES